ncbi:tetratricopeptide repeat protein [Embleya scabrispora]|uniref:tetratricopeptide repeat protein n=1 Tax=Embleya scabrispora TaxID=159449 RepID=UPI0013750680|nr:tetratricopeptide repeat protein [Embleya scabrispora]
MNPTPEYASGLDFENKRERLGLYDPETLHALHRYAVAVGAVPGRTDDAVELLTWLVGARTDDEENRLAVLDDLTRLLQDGGRPVPAERWLREALSGWTRLPGPSDPRPLQIASNLGMALLDLDRREEAESLMRDTVARYTRTLGATHPDTLRSRDILAGSLRGSPTRLAEAEHMYRAIPADVDGTTAPALIAQHNLGAVLTRQGNHDEALRTASWSAPVRLLGDDHPDTWGAWANSAVVLHTLGRITEAETLLTEVLHAYRRIHGPRHVATLEAQVDLAAMRANQSHNAEAAPLLRDAIEGYRSTHGPSHPIVGELAGVLARMGD